MPAADISLLYAIFVRKILIVNFIKAILHRKYVLKSNIDKSLKWIPVMVSIRMWGQ